MIAISNRRRQNPPMLDLFPDTARIEAGVLSIGGLTAADLVGDFGSPLVVYDEATVRAQARAYRASFKFNKLSAEAQLALVITIIDSVLARIDSQSR